MTINRASVGASLLALLVAVDIVSLFVTYTPAPFIAIITALGLVVLGALGLWATGRSPRRSMWVAVVPAVIIALLGVPPLFIPDMTFGERAYFIMYLLFTLVAVLLASGELSRRTERSPASGQPA